MEQHEKLGEMQFGFPKDSRGEDCIFILTTAIGIARQEGTGLITCFLDCTRAYDRIDQQRLWDTLEERGGMPGPMLKLLERLYTESEITLRYGEL